MNHTLDGFRSNQQSHAPLLLKLRLVDVRILETDGGFVVEWESLESDQSNDSWHATLAEAQRQAQDQFGIGASEWEHPDGDI